MKTSSHMTACNVSASEAHNKREKKLDYIREELSEHNEFFSYIPHNLPTELANIKREVKDKTGRKLQKNAVPIKESVVVIKNDTTMDELKDFCEECRNKFGIVPLQIAIHRDEGHVKSKDWKPNLHAHITWRMYNKEGRNVRLSREGLSEMQDIAAQCLNMERGKKSNKKHLNAIEFKIKAIEEELEQTRAENTELKNENNKLKEENSILDLKNKKLQYKVKELSESKEELTNKIESLKPEVQELTELLSVREKDLALIDQKTTKIAKFLNWSGASKSDKMLAEQTLSLTKARNDLLQRDRDYNELKHKHNKLQSEYDVLKVFSSENELKSKESTIRSYQNILNAGVTLGLTASEMKQLTQRSVVPFKREGLIDTNLSLMGGEVRIEHNKSWLTIKDWMSRVGSQILSQIQKAGEQIKSAFKR